MALAPYWKKAVIIDTPSTCGEVQGKLAASLRRWAFVRDDTPQIIGRVRGNRITLRVVPRVRDPRNPEFHGVISATSDGGARVSGVVQTSTPYRFIAVPAVTLLAGVSLAVLVARVAAGDSLLHPFFFVAVAFALCLAVAVLFVPGLQPEDLDLNAEAMLAWLETGVGGNVVPADVVNADD